MIPLISYKWSLGAIFGLNNIHSTAMFALWVRYAIATDSPRTIFSPNQRKMDRVQELINVLAEKEVIARTAIAKARHACKICGGPAGDFRSPRSALEYTISSICQTCQDYYFPSEH